MRFDLRAYLARIGLVRRPTVDVAGLDAVVLAHTTSVPFENLDVLAGRPVDTGLDAVVDKLVNGRRGGYCFEHATLLEAALCALGFDAHVVAGRARVSTPRPAPAPRTHAMLVVRLPDGPRLVDAAVGARTATASLALVDGLAQETPHDVRRLDRHGEVWLHQVQQDGDWLEVAETRLEPMPPEDRTVASWYTSTHPGSPFRKERMVALAARDGGRSTLRGTLLTRRSRDATLRTDLAPEEVDEALERVFGLLPG